MQIILEKELVIKEVPTGERNRAGRLNCGGLQLTCVCSFSVTGLGWLTVLNNHHQNARALLRVHKLNTPILFTQKLFSKTKRNKA